MIIVPPRAWTRASCCLFHSSAGFHSRAEQRAAPAAADVGLRRVLGGQAGVRQPLGVGRVGRVEELHGAQRSRRDERRRVQAERLGVVAAADDDDLVRPLQVAEEGLGVGRGRDPVLLVVRWPRRRGSRAPARAGGPRRCRPRGGGGPRPSPRSRRAPAPAAPAGRRTLPARRACRAGGRPARTGARTSSARGCAPAAATAARRSARRRRGGPRRSPSGRRGAARRRRRRRPGARSAPWRRRGAPRRAGRSSSSRARSASSGRPRMGAARSSARAASAFQST